MNINRPLALLGGLTPHAFMQDYWQKKPLLIRQAIPGFVAPLSLDDVRAMAHDEGVESRLIKKKETLWHMEFGPFDRLPSPRQPDWTLLVQNVDAHDDEIAHLLHQFRFIPDARLDDAMISIAGVGGGVGPHFDSYDVFLLQAHGQRQWRISQQSDLDLEKDVPLKILKNFTPEDEYVLEPGDMLYLPPHIAHDGIARTECMTISIGFRAPTRAALARGMLDIAGDHVMARVGDASGLYSDAPLPGPVLSGTYTDPDANATSRPAELPNALLDAALQAVREVKFDEALAARFLGLWLTEPSPAAYFEPSEHAGALDGALPETGHVVLDRCTRLMYRGDEAYINGELITLTPSPSLRTLADTRKLACTAALAHSMAPAELDMLTTWLNEGWVHYRPEQHTQCV